LATLPELETARLTLRRLTLADAPFLVTLLTDPSFLENIGYRGVRGVEDVPRYLNEGPFAMYERHGFGLWLVARRADGVSIGTCGLLKRAALPDVDLGYAYLPAYWGQGYAFEAGDAVLQHGARKFGLRRVIGVVSPGNAGSIRVLEKLGMRFERTVVMQAGEPEIRLYGRALDCAPRLCGAGVTGA
jgi:[ribosomal protein S5]-alanine N-acetyltransferase